MKGLFSLIGRLYAGLIRIGNFLQAPALLVLRIYFFWQLFQTGQEKLSNLPKVTEFFTSLHIPFPAASAVLVGSLECFGSLLLVVGFGTRFLSLLFIINMGVAYLAADREALFSFITNPDKFQKADPFPYLFAAGVLFVFGPGLLSLDALLRDRLPEKRRPLRASFIHQ